MTHRAEKIWLSVSISQAWGFSNVGLGVVHGMAHPLGAFYDTPHGIANAVLLPYVMEYNAEYTGEKFKYIAEAMGVDTTNMNQAEYRASRSKRS